jgi:hypothetical protein
MPGPAARQGEGRIEDGTDRSEGNNGGFSLGCTGVGLEAAPTRSFEPQSSILTIPSLARPAQLLPSLWSKRPLCLTAETHTIGAVDKEPSRSCGTPLRQRI